MQRTTFRDLYAATTVGPEVRKQAGTLILVATGPNLIWENSHIALDLRNHTALMVMVMVMVMVPRVMVPRMMVLGMMVLGVMVLGAMVLGVVALGLRLLGRLDCFVVVTSSIETIQCLSLLALLSAENFPLLSCSRHRLAVQLHELPVSIRG